VPEILLSKNFYVGAIPGTKDWTGGKNKMWHVPRYIVEAKRLQDPEMFQEPGTKRLELWLQSIAKYLPGAT